MQTEIDFAYAFATPHRLTVALPDSSHKTLLDCTPDQLGVSWTYADMTDRPLTALMPPRTDWSLKIWPEVDGQPLASDTWTRMEGSLPALEQRFAGPDGTCVLEVVGGATAAIGRITVHNPSPAAHRFTLVCTSKAWGEVPAWLDPELPADVLLAGWLERADRVLAFGLGAQTFPLRRDMLGKTIAIEWVLGPGESAVGWLLRPYRAYRADLPALRAHDWAAEFEAGLQVWRALLARAVCVQIPDPGVRRALYACLADLFIMREPVAEGYIAAEPGTEGYRSPGAGEPAIVVVALDQFGLHAESAEGYRMELDQQGEDGDWADPRGWGHTWWSCSGFKAWTVSEHYRLTGDRQYLENVYPRLLASARHQERRRARTRILVDGQRPLTYGLMPRGFGDCGLWDDDDMYGVFLPHNIWAVYADRVALEAAQALGRGSKELDELRRIYETARDDLLQALEAGAIVEEGYRWIPGTPGKTCGSRWGALNALFPCHILPPQHELIDGTIRYMSQHLSAGGQPIHTGWMEDGMWVAITLDNLAQAHLARGEGDPAADYLLSSLNHGTPLFTWCEERGQEPGSAKTSGDRQHLFTPVAVVRALRDTLVMEQDDGLQLALATPRSWLASGEPVGIAAAPTHFGPVSFELCYDAAQGEVRGRVQLPADRGPARLALHLRLPQGLRAQALQATPSARLEDAGTVVRWSAPRGELSFTAQVV